MFERKQELEKVKEDSNLVKSLLGEGEEGIQREHYKTQIEIKQYLKQFNLIKKKSRSSTTTNMKEYFRHKQTQSTMRQIKLIKGI